MAGYEVELLNGGGSMCTLKTCGGWRSRTLSPDVEPSPERSFRSSLRGIDSYQQLARSFVGVETVMQDLC